MKKELLIVVDMQNDFVTGVLGTPEAQAILPKVVEKVKTAIDNGVEVIFTQDTHGENYLSTQEGKKLPVVHCVKGTQGWEIVPELKAFTAGRLTVEKPSFGSVQLAHIVGKGGYESIQLIGLCTDICVISNAMVLKAALPEVPISVDASCCAGVSPASHDDALAAMEMCQIDIL